MTDDKKIYFGKIIWFSASKGIGFISWENEGVPQKDMFLHFSDIAIQGFKTVKKDTQVSFQIGTNNKGQPKAINITPLEIKRSDLN